MTGIIIAACAVGVTGSSSWDSSLDLWERSLQLRLTRRKLDVRAELPG